MSEVLPSTPKGPSPRRKPLGEFEETIFLLHTATCCPLLIPAKSLVWDPTQQLLLQSKSPERNAKFLAGPRLWKHAAVWACSTL